MEYIERKFREYIGITPKRYAGIVKSSALVELMPAQLRTKWSKICAATGFNDYSHLSKHTSKQSELHPRNLKQR